MLNQTDQTWLSALDTVFNDYKYTSEPRGQKIRELINYSYTTDLNSPIITHDGRNLNYPFMFAEAAWILQGRNDLKYITKHMKNYANFSDDGVTLNGAYGPKFVDQISWAANELKNDPDSRRCFINIWRERPGVSKDIPCTTGLQFIQRDGDLNLVVNMRSQDCVWGMPYDIFTFSCIAKYMQLFLYEHHNVCVALDQLHVRVGSFHLYEHHFDDASAWLEDRSTTNIETKGMTLFACTRASEFVSNLEKGAEQLSSLKVQTAQAKQH